MVERETSDQRMNSYKYAICRSQMYRIELGQPNRRKF